MKAEQTQALSLPYVGRDARHAHRTKALDFVACFAKKPSSKGPLTKAFPSPGGSP